MAKNEGDTAPTIDADALSEASLTAAAAAAEQALEAAADLDALAVAGRAVGITCHSLLVNEPLPMRIHSPLRDRETLTLKRTSVSW